MYNSRTTPHGFQLCLPSPPSQLLTIHTPTSLDNLEALEHLGSDPVLFLAHAVLPLLHLNFLKGWGDVSLLCIPSPHSACYGQVLSGWSFALRFRLF